jgi:transmembrane sensor
MDIKGINELLERYRNNQCTAEEKKSLEQWFDAQSAVGEWEWTMAEENASSVRIKNQIDQQLFEKRTNWWPLLRVAAILTLVVGSLLYFRQDIHNWVDPVAFLEKKVADGQQIKLTLADGSKVWLNGGTRFRYPDRFANGKREVFLLEGEAYFEVSHDTTKPFIVTSNQINTKVLGTAFNVKTYPYLSNIQVVVTRGKVRVSDTTGKAMLVLPDQQLSIDKRSGAMERQNIDAKTALAWQQGGYSFNNDRMLDVCAVLAKKYRIDFHFRNQDIEDYRLTMGFVQTDKLEDILAVLASANNLSFTSKNNKVVFYKK